MNTDTRRFLEALFVPGELVSTYGPHPSHLVYHGPWEDAVAAEYINANPMSGANRRAREMADYRSFLLEFDNVSLAQQETLIAALSKFIPLRTVTYSGNKSFAAIPSLSDTLISGNDGEMRALLYSEYFKRLRSTVEHLLRPLVTETYSGTLIDAANADASRLTRLPGTLNRHWKEPGRSPTQQTLVSVGPLITSQEFQNFLDAHEPPSAPSVMIKHAQCYNGSFERTLANQSHLKGLRNTLTLPESWAGPNGNHPLLYRYTHWAIDATGVSQTEFLDYVKRNTAPYLLSLGYPMWKIEEAIAGAYRMRNLRGRSA